MATPPEKHRNGLIGTILFHSLLLLLLFFMALAPPDPMPEEQGIMLLFGDNDGGMGTVQPRMSDPASSQPRQSNQAQQDLVTQDFEDAPALPSAPSPRPNPSTETRPANPQPQPAAEPDREPERTVNPSALFPGRGDQSSTSTSQGDAGVPGNQGSPTGTPNASGVGGITVGGGLSGRGTVGAMPRPAYEVQEQGIVIVEVTVDRSGNVTEATIARGTTITNSTLQGAALRAARQTKFEGNNEFQQRGTITYNFRLQ